MTKKEPTPKASDRAIYYAEAASWAEDRQAGLRRSRGLAWIIAGATVMVAGLEAVALASLAPLKTVEPYTILVDRQTGYTQMLKGDGSQRITADEALTQSLLAQYVVARESFDITTLASDYRKVGLWSAESARENYLRVMQPGNPDSPVSRLPRSSVVTTRVKSVSMLGPSTALVRFDTERLDQGQMEGAHQPWVAVLRFRYAQAPMAVDDRLINPLGFQVVQYRRDQEALSVPDAKAAQEPGGQSRAPLPGASAATTLPRQPAAK